MHGVRDLSAVSFTVSDEPNADGLYVAECNDLPFCVAEGATPEEAWTNARQAANRCLAMLSEPVVVGRRHYPRAA